MNRLTALYSKQILIVEDDPVQRELERALLESIGLRVAEAGNGEQGLALARELEPDLIVLDILMPKMDGFEFCRQLRADPKLQFTPVLITTGLDDTESIEAAFEAGAGDFVTKPINLHLLPYRLLALLRTSALMEELRSEKTNAISASRAKSQFLAAVSHELRTPLNAIIGFSNLMKDQWLGPLGNDKYLSYSQDIYNSGTHLLKVINDILDIAKIEAGKFEPFIESVKLADILSQCVSLMRPLAQDGDLKIITSVSPDVQMLTDERAIKQIVINVLSNAIKFSARESSISVTGYCAADTAIISIVDNGIGMSEDELAIAKQPFQQVDGDLDRRYGGTGLGLPLSISLAKAIGGKLEISSQRGIGTRVDIVMPATGVADNTVEAQFHAA